MKKIEDIAIDASRRYKCLNIKNRFHSLLRRVFSRHYERNLEKDIKSMEE